MLWLRSPAPHSKEQGMTIERWGGMTQEEKNVTCAVRDGWKASPSTVDPSLTMYWKDGGVMGVPPDYADPRNYERLRLKAIEKDGESYSDNLTEVVRPSCEFGIVQTSDVACANSDQICLAAVLTLGGE